MERSFMVQSHLRSRGITDVRVLDAFEKVPRDAFVLENDRPEAYSDHPLSIGAEQTISQPYIVGLMTQALAITGGERVLEIGTGSGYQTALLSMLAKWVYTVERVESLLVQAEKRLEDMGADNISFRLGDGTLGWQEEAPYDRILVTAAAPDIPAALESQLIDGGRMVIPVGGVVGQELLLVTRVGEHLKREHLCGCIFVKLIGEQGWE